MQNFQTYSISSIAKDDRIFVIDDNKQTFPRLISNDSGICFGDSDNESILSDEYEFDIDQNNNLNEQQSITIINDGRRKSSRKIFLFISFLI